MIGENHPTNSPEDFFHRKDGLFELENDTLAPKPTLFLTSGHQ